MPPDPNDIPELEKQIRSDYCATFSTEQGARTLRHLMNRNFFFAPTAAVDHDQMQRNEGRREAILEILGLCQVLSQGAAEMLAMRDESITDYQVGSATEAADLLDDQ